VRALRSIRKAIQEIVIRFACPAVPSTQEFARRQGRVLGRRLEWTESLPALRRRGGADLRRFFDLRIGRRFFLQPCAAHTAESLVGGILPTARMALNEPR